MPLFRTLLAAVLALFLAACANRSITTVQPEAAGIGTNVTVYAASARRQLADGNFGYARSPELTLLEIDVSVPPDYETGDAKFGFANPDPQREFVLTSRKIYDTATDMRRRIRQDLSALPPKEREIIVFVHGYNNTQIEVAYRSAQLKHDLGLKGAVVFYSWPSRGSALGYAYDEDSALFARDGLEGMLRNIRSSSNLPLIVVAHSMGGQLTMEALRQIEIKNPGWSKQNLSGLVLMSPDLDVEVFRTQVQRFKELPTPFVIFANRKDHALGISQRLRGGQGENRLGNIASLNQVADLPVQVVDTSDLKQSRDLNHFPAANSPALISMLSAVERTNDAFELPDERLAESLPGSIARVGEAVRVILTPPITQ